MCGSWWKIYHTHTTVIQPENYSGLPTQPRHAKQMVRLSRKKVQDMQRRSHGHRNGQARLFSSWTTVARLHRLTKFNGRHGENEFHTKDGKTSRTSQIVRHMSRAKLYWPLETRRSGVVLRFLNSEFNDTAKKFFCDLLCGRPNMSHHGFWMSVCLSRTKF